MEMDPTRQELLLADYKMTSRYFFDLASVRFKLLTFLPTITGTIVGGLIGFTEPNPPLLAFVGAFGFVVTLGILFYDQRNTQIYDAMVIRAQSLEILLGFPPLTKHLAGESRARWRMGGAFLDRPERSLRLIPIPRCGRHLFRMWHDRGLALIYSAVLAGWTFALVVGASGADPVSRDWLIRPIAYVAPAAVFLYFLALIHLYDALRNWHWGIQRGLRKILGAKLQDGCESTLCRIATWLFGETRELKAEEPPANLNGE